MRDGGREGGSKEGREGGTDERREETLPSLHAHLFTGTMRQ